MNTATSVELESLSLWERYVKETGYQPSFLVELAREAKNRGDDGALDFFTSLRRQSQSEWRLATVSSWVRWGWMDFRTAKRLASIFAEQEGFIFLHTGCEADHALYRLAFVDRDVHAVDPNNRLAFSMMTSGATCRGSSRSESTSLSEDVWARLDGSRVEPRNPVLQLSGVPLDAGSKAFVDRLQERRYGLIAGFGDEGELTVAAVALGLQQARLPVYVLQRIDGGPIVLLEEGLGEGGAA